jgi:hypothetical protein
MKVKCSQCGQRYLAKGEAELIVILGGHDCPKCKGEGTVDIILKPAETPTLDITVAYQPPIAAAQPQRRQKT